MTLTEFLAPLARASYRDQVLGVLYYLKRYENSGQVTVQQVRGALQRARTPKWKKINVAAVLSRSGAYVDSPGVSGNKFLWSITNTGEHHVRELLGLPAAEPEIEHDVGALQKVAAAIADAVSRDYVDEAIKCLRAGALRASVVFLWSGAMRILQDQLLTGHSANLNSVLRKHDPKARNVTRVEHFAYVKDKLVLLAAQDLGILDKNEKDTLEEGLGLRNRVGHPGKYRPGEKKVSAFIEDVISIVFQ